ncbi:lactonase family protein [Lentisphaerota bacterium ZTH]|nr:lactonase family protein [Lentisphaerota bacterium]WET06909.1 lactonase family protein [Lentisphaerota bacterium ZTH]
MGAHWLLYVGSYTRTPYEYTGAKATGQGIYLLDFNLSTGQLKPPRKVFLMENPAYFVFSPDNRFLFVNSEVPEWSEGRITTYRVNRKNGSLKYIGHRKSYGALPFYFDIDSTGKWLFAVNYLGGNALIFPVHDDGTLGKPTDNVYHHGSGIDRLRQAGPHPHCIVLDPSGRFCAVPDLGLDKIFFYELDLKYGKLFKYGFVKVPAGSGPRRFVYHPNRKYAYNTNEMSGTVTSWTYDESKGWITHLGIHKCLPESEKCDNAVGDIKIHPSGKFVYVSNRGHDSISVFRVNSYNGKLNLESVKPTGGRTPRSILIDPTGKFLLVVNQLSDTINCFKINQNDGSLRDSGFRVEVPTPNYLTLKCF